MHAQEQVKELYLSILVEKEKKEGLSPKILIFAKMLGLENIGSYLKHESLFYFNAYTNIKNKKLG